MQQLHIISEGPNVLMTVKVVPGSSRTALAGVLGGMLKVKIAAAPEKGKANKALIQFLSKQLGTGRNDIEIISGQTNPVKQVRVTGLTAEDVRARLQL